MSMNISSVFALFIGMFIIYNSFSIAVTQRRSEIGILRALGAPRRQIRNLFLIESAVSGLLGSIAGIALGIVMARGMVGSISNMLEGIYGVAERAEEVSADPRLLGARHRHRHRDQHDGRVAAGAQRVARRSGAGAAERQVSGADGRRESRAPLDRRRADGRGARAACGSARRSGSTPGTSSIILAALLLVPTVALWLSRALRPVLKWLRPVEGALAADSLIQSPRRTSGAVAALMLSLGQVIGLGGIGRESYNSIVDWLDTALNPDLFVAGSQNLSDRTFRFPKTLGRHDRGAFLASRMCRPSEACGSTSAGRPVMLIAIDAASFERRGHRPTVAEDPRGMYRWRGRARRDRFGQLLATSQANRLAIASTCRRLAGCCSLPIAGIITDWSDQQGSIFLDRTVYERYWKDDTVERLPRVRRTWHRSTQTVRQRILERLSPSASAPARADQRRGAELGVCKLTDQWLQLTYSQVFIAVLVAILGIVNTLTVSIIDRKRELGVLRAVGGFRRQIRQTVWMEAVAIGLVGLALGSAVRRRESVFPAADYRTRSVGDVSAVPISLSASR